MHKLQPLIWLARSWTRPSVRDGTPPCSADAFRAYRACMASGTIVTGLLIRACMICVRSTVTIRLPISQPISYE